MMRTAEDLLLGVSRDPQAPLVNAYRVDGIHDPGSHQLGPDSHQPGSDSRQLSPNTHHPTPNAHQLAADTHRLAADTHQLSPDSHQRRATTPPRLVEQIPQAGSRPRRDSMPDRGQQAGLAEARHRTLVSNRASVAKCMFDNRFLFEWKPSP
jgi:hypothetical protein